MTSIQIETEIARPTADLDAIAERFVVLPALLREVFAGLRADKARVKYRCLKLLRHLSEKRPTVLYPDFDEFAALLGSDNNILRWGAIIIVGNMAAVDADNKIDALLDQFLQPIQGPALITAANTIDAAAKIARAKPHLADRIVRALLQVETARYQTPECRNVALGHVLKSLDLAFEQIRDRRPVLDFAKRQLRNRRNAVKLRARKFLAKHGQTVKPGGAATAGVPRPPARRARIAGHSVP